jgi:hypothetical protein
MQGVFRSSTSDSSGVADESGVFLVKKDAGAPDGTRSICMFFRQRGGQFDKKCAQDPGNKLRLYSKCFWQSCKDIRDARGDAARRAEHADRSGDLQSSIKP